MTHRRPHLALASAAAVFVFVVGCGRIVTLEPDARNQELATLAEGGGGAPVVQEAGIDAGKDAIVPGIVPPAPDTCATYTPGYDAVPSGGHVGSPKEVYGCRVAVDVGGMNGQVLAMKDGVVGNATFDGDTLRFACYDSTTQLMAATIRCYKAAGVYEIPAGALVLGTHVSDRPCRLDVDYSVADAQIRGFISCDTTPADPTNVFANTTAPIGLGDYALLPQN